ncbi:hypothetical protein M422DRAFT_27075 [Sphaerobolus stellatus SS14]|nr:hypothetical protein M422DRAFT_27075 [Sphaerobolus stellatus SS14]
MASAQPPWLHSSLRRSHIKRVVKILDSRETSREDARTVVDSRSSHQDDSTPPHLKDYYSCSVGQQSIHKRKNRYIQLEPYDRTRVLVPIPGDHREIGEENHRYINANWVREFAGGKWWIAGQAPLPETIHAFLTLSMHPTPPLSAHALPSSVPPPRRRVQTIVQLTLLVEAGRQRAHPYFPDVLKENMIIHPERGLNAPPIHIHVESEEHIAEAACVLTDLRLRWEIPPSNRTVDHEEWQVTHLLYTAWPDFGVPRENHTILNFARLVERVNNRNLLEGTSPKDAPPVLVHCSAGVGRTGSFVALCSLLRAHGLLAAGPPVMTPTIAPPLPQSPLGPLPPDLNNDLVAREVDALREQRQSMVQRPEQVAWIYSALADAFEDIAHSHS